MVIRVSLFHVTEISIPIESLPVMKIVMHGIIRYIAENGTCHDSLQEWNIIGERRYDLIDEEDEWNREGGRKGEPRGVQWNDVVDSMSEKVYEIASEGIRLHVEQESMEHIFDGPPQEKSKHQ